MICIGSDHAAFELKNHIKEYLINKGYKVNDVGVDAPISVNYPTYGEKVGRAVANGEAECGIVICGTGLGISMAASRVKGIRCALCTNTYMSKMARQHNNANVLAMGARVIGSGLAEEIVDAFLTTEFEGGRHAVRVAMLDEIKD